MISYFLNRSIFLLLGTLYPAYCSFKAIRGKNVKEYVKWTMYWIVFALFLCIENFTDLFLSWMPFYLELKIIIILWLVLPMTRGSSYLYRKWIHPYLKKYEPTIDEGVAQLGRTGLTIVRRLGIKGMNIAAQTVVGGAMIGQEAIGEAIRRSSQSEGEARGSNQEDPGYYPEDHQGGPGSREVEDQFEIIDDEDLPPPPLSASHPPTQQWADADGGPRERKKP